MMKLIKPIFWFILLAATPSPALAETRFGLGLDGGYASVKSSNSSELSLNGNTGSVYIGASFLPTPTTVAAISLGYQGYTLASSNEVRKQTLLVDTIMLQGEYRWRFGGWEPGLLARFNYGQTAQLKITETSRSLMIVAGPQIAHRWHGEEYDPLLFVAATIALNVPKQTNITAFFGLQAWFGEQSAPQPMTRAAAAPAKAQPAAPVKPLPDKAVATAADEEPEVKAPPPVAAKTKAKKGKKEKLGKVAAAAKSPAKPAVDAATAAALKASTPPEPKSTSAKSTSPKSDTAKSEKAAPTEPEKPVDPSSFERFTAGILSSTSAAPPAATANVKPAAAEDAPAQAAAATTTPPPTAAAPAAAVVATAAVATAAAPAPSAPTSIKLRLRADVVEFLEGSTELSKRSQANAAKIAAVLNADDRVWGKLLIAGHSDSMSTDPKRNQAVSLHRAEAIKKSFIGAGVNRTKLKTKGFGATEPLPGVPGDASENRRVELRFERVTNASKLILDLKNFIYDGKAAP